MRLSRGNKSRTRRKTKTQSIASAEYKNLLAKRRRSRESSQNAKDEEIAKQIALLDRQRAAIGDAFKDARGNVGSLIYQYEIVPGSEKTKKEARMKELMNGRKSIWKVDWPLADGKIKPTSPSPATTQRHLHRHHGAARRAGRAARRNRQTRERSPRRRWPNTCPKNLPGLSSATLEGLRTFHARTGTSASSDQREPARRVDQLSGRRGSGRSLPVVPRRHGPRAVPPGLTLTKADLGMAKSHDAPFTSHPDPELLELHPLEKFGCSPCHGGNGRALDSVTARPRPLRALALAALLSRKFQRGLPAVPCRRHGHRARRRC